MLWASGRLGAEMNPESQTSLITDSWNKAWRKLTIPFLALVACLDERDMKRACSLASSMVEQLAENTPSKKITPSQLGKGQASQRMRKHAECGNVPVRILVLE